MREAGSLIDGDGRVLYGPPKENLARIAALWCQLLNVRIDPWQVCAMMAVKIVRLIAGAHRGGFVDGTAYVARAGEQA